MAYVKPGIEITQVEQSPTPTLIAPDLEAVVVGQAYWWQEMTEADDTYSSTLASEVSLSGINADHRDTTGEDNLVLVDLRTQTGTRVLLTYNTDFTVSTSNGTTTLTIVSGLQSGDVNMTGASIFVAYRTANTDGEGFKVIESSSQIVDQFGLAKSWNVLAYGAQLALDNSGATVNTYGMSSSAAAIVSTALDELETKEVYAMGILGQVDMSSVVGAVSTHVTSMSTAVNKKERIAFVCKTIPFDGAAYAEDATEKLATATAISVANVALQNKRLFSIHPEMVYIEETRHISTLNPTWIAASFSDSSDVTLGTSPLLAILKNDITLGSTKYFKGGLITDAVFTALKDNFQTDDMTLSVWAPVPGYYQAAAAAGMVVGKRPEAPLTNVPLTGFAKAKGAGDYFSESNLNVMAAGGTYIIEEKALNTLSSRHQLATNMSSVSLRELSIVNVLDYTAKFIRNAFAPYIGRRTISPAFLTLAETILVGIAFYLKREGFINDLQVLSIVQDEINPDTLLVDVSILVKYPVNYIKIRLIF